ncbi:hypothetical protein ACFPM0_18055 [Pseudonocardia sulfidoxydans]|uniref:hypothetical protein n=1 Tax=Pseudonocardia sulfidoxydans TaxID=54011 RepID=UPI003606EAB6
MDGGCPGPAVALAGRARPQRLTDASDPYRPQGPGPEPAVIVVGGGWTTDPSLSRHDR